MRFRYSTSDPAQDEGDSLGQANFFMEFDICFFRSQLEFEIKPRSSG